MTARRVLAALASCWLLALCRNAGARGATDRIGLEPPGNGDA